MRTPARRSRPISSSVNGRRRSSSPLTPPKDATAPAQPRAASPPAPPRAKTPGNGPAPSPRKTPGRTDASSDGRFVTNGSGPDAPSRTSHRQPDQLETSGGSRYNEPPRPPGLTASCASHPAAAGASHPSSAAASDVEAQATSRRSREAASYQACSGHQDEASAGAGSHRACRRNRTASDEDAYRAFTLPLFLRRFRLLAIRRSSDSAMPVTVRRPARLRASSAPMNLRCRTVFAGTTSSSASTW